MFKTIKTYAAKSILGCRSLIDDIKKKPENLLIAMLMLLLPVFVFAAIDPSKDMLAGAKIPITNNFGPSSTAAWITYILEAAILILKAFRKEDYRYFIAAGGLPIATAIMWSVIT